MWPTGYAHLCPCREAKGPCRALAWGMQCRAAGSCQLLAHLLGRYCTE